MDKSKKETAKNRRMANITGNIGLHYACYRLSLLGLNVMPTARNTKGVDILVHDYECKKIVAVQVKTRAVNTGVQICLRKEPQPHRQGAGRFLDRRSAFPESERKRRQFPNGGRCLARTRPRICR